MAAKGAQWERIAGEQLAVRLQADGLSQLPCHVWMPDDRTDTLRPHCLTSLDRGHAVTGEHKAQP